MNYISAEEFLKQSDKVQKVLLEWWKENMQILDFYKTKSILCNVIYISNQDQINAIKKFINDVIPILQMNQIIQFIEHKGYKYMGMNNFHGIWVVKLLKTQSQFQLDAEIEDNDLLQALWKVAIEIAECQ